MTDRELMQQALEALNRSDYLGWQLNIPIIKALRERLGQQEHHDPIGDAQDKLIAGKAATRDYRTRYDRGCYKCGSHYCPADCHEPTHLVPQQPQMQPCAGRNCGSTNPNLHSAECFEDYEKATGMAQPVALETVYETIIQWDEGGGKRSRRELARRIVDLYTTPPQRKPLTDEEIEKIWWETKPYFDKHDFTRAIEAAHGITGEEK